MGIKLLVYYSLQYPDCNWDNRDRTKTVYVVSIVLLEKGCDSNRFAVFWEFTLSERVIKNIAHRHTNEVGALPNKSHRYSV